MQKKWKSKFQLKSGKWVFEPTAEAIALGNKIKLAVESAWTSPSNYFHLRSGGHVAAVRSHLDGEYFLRVDIQDFFGSINRSRITRCLNSLFNYTQSREWANASTVPAPSGAKRLVLPFGFVQSQIISALCLQQSRLGRCLDSLSGQLGVTVSVYVDDIIISGSSPDRCQAALDHISEAATRARFELNRRKLEGPATSISAFNIILSNSRMEITAERMREFRAAIESNASATEKSGVIGYVTSVNLAQAAELLSRIETVGNSKSIDQP